MSHSFRDFQVGAAVWHADFGFGTVLRSWQLCPSKCLDVMFDDGEVQFVLPADLQLVVPLSERFPEEA